VLGLNTSEKRPEAPVKLAPSMKWWMSRMSDPVTLATGSVL